MNSGVATCDVPCALTGIGIGALLLTFFGCVWLGLGLASLTMNPLWLAVALALLAVALLVPSFGIFRMGYEAAHRAGPMTEEQKRVQRRMGRAFGIIFAAEGLLIFVAVNVLNNLHREQYVLTAIAAIVGLHFLPLARLYRFPLYYAVGVLMVLDGFASLALPAPGRNTTLALSVGAVLWLTCAALIRRGFRLARVGHASQV
ncbi:MAG TPA: hypothetical protein VL240_07980 [Candidatus Binatia bacterium]|nr:hypothetical protein [Candidatus Binatia bacterium]